MIILGSTSTHDVPWLPFGSVSLRLLHTATKPVLIVPKARVKAEAHAAAVLAGATN
jgi:nucleotide-binding universal stress UspA family protein